MKLRFRCSHPALDVDVDKVPSPKCPQCGARVRRVLGAANELRPRIRGHGTGPLVDSKYLPAVPVNLAPGGPLRLKKESD